jgi:choline dehydrogenase-like flavoprotein
VHDLLALPERAGRDGVPGLFVSDASLFPGPIGINPMETIIALTLRNAQRLIERRGQYGI